MHAGTIVGKQNWGALIGILAFPLLMAGGSVTAPNFGFYDPEGGTWSVKKHGANPDIKVEADPHA